MVDLDSTRQAGQGATGSQRRVVDRRLAFPQVINDQSADRLAGDGVTVDQLPGGRARRLSSDRGRAAWEGPRRQHW